MENTIQILGVSQSVYRKNVNKDEISKPSDFRTVEYVKLKDNDYFDICVDNSDKYETIQTILSDLKLNKSQQPQVVQRQSQKTSQTSTFAVLDYAKRLSKSDELLNIKSKNKLRQLFLTKFKENKDKNTNNNNAIKKNKKLYRNFSKSEIGLPQDFVHVEHVGI